MNDEATPVPLLPYPSDLTDEQWTEIEPLFEDKKTPKANGQAGGVGRPYSTTMRQIVNGVLYQAYTGIPWRFLPRDIHPVYQTIYAHYTAWERDGTLETIYERLNIVPPTDHAEGEGTDAPARYSPAPHEHPCGARFRKVTSNKQN